MSREVVEIATQQANALVFGQVWSVRTRRIAGHVISAQRLLPHSRETPGIDAPIRAQGQCALASCRESGSLSLESKQRWFANSGVRGSERTDSETGAGWIPSCAGFSQTRFGTDPRARDALGFRRLIEPGRMVPGPDSAGEEADGDQRQQAQTDHDQREAQRG
jgi:hypothetical protein